MLNCHFGLSSNHYTAVEKLQKNRTNYQQKCKKSIAQKVASSIFFTEDARKIAASSARQCSDMGKSRDKHQ